MSQSMQWKVGQQDLESEVSASEEPVLREALRMRRLLRRTCCRIAAPDTLRQRILANLPHRGGDVGESR